MEILLSRMKYTHEIVGTHGGALLLERAPGACSGSKIPRVYWPGESLLCINSNLRLFITALWSGERGSIGK